MRTGKLNALAVRRLTQPGRYSDGGNLYLFVKPRGSRLWTFRYKATNGKQREMSLGDEQDISLAEARDKARDARRLLHDGRDPIDSRQAAKPAAIGAGMKFDDVVKLYIAAHEASWKNEKHRAQWRSTLAQYASPEIGQLSVASIEVSHILRVLEPIWQTKAETASRLRGRLEAVLAYAAAHGWRGDDNPARWRDGRLSKLLPTYKRLASIEHHAALPWSEAPDLMTRLAALKGAAR